MIGKGTRVTAFAAVLVLGAAPLASQAPAALLGRFEDDYGSRHEVSDSLWRHGSRASYRIVRWDSAGRFLVAQNDAGNPSDGGRWTRIDWIPLEGMAPYTWAFCMSAYDAPTADSAARVTIADRSTPRTGCNGFPFTRMRAADDGTGARRPDRYRGDSLPPE